MKPHILALAVPADGHVRPIRNVVVALKKLGYDVTFLTGAPFQKLIEDSGISFVELPTDCSFNASHMDTRADMINAGASLDEIMVWACTATFFDPILKQSNIIQKVLQRLSNNNVPVVIIKDFTIVGTTPMFLGAPNMIRAPVISIGLFPLSVSSVDAAPFGRGVICDSSPESRMQYKDMNDGYFKMFSATNDAFKKDLKSVGVTKEIPFCMDSWTHCSDRYLQMSVPEFEYPRSDLPKNVKFIGRFPDAKPASMEELPDWYNSFVEQRPHGTPLIVVTQGTLTGGSADFLIIPTIKACTGLKVRLVVCYCSCEIPSDVFIPENIKLVKFLPFSIVMKDMDIFVTNAGYGGVNHALSEGVPIIAAGVREDKIEVSARVEWTGCGINLKTETPTIGQVKEAIEKMIVDQNYKKRAMELKASFDNYNAIDGLVSTINELSTNSN